MLALNVIGLLVFSVVSLIVVLWIASAIAYVLKHRNMKEYEIQKEYYRETGVPLPKDFFDKSRDPSVE